MKKSSARSLESNFLPIVVSLTVALLLVMVIVNKLPFTAQARVSELGNIVNFDSSDVAITDNNEAGVRSDLTLVPQTSYISVTCNDPDGCHMRFDNGSGKTGDMVFVSFPARSYPVEETALALNVLTPVFGGMGVTNSIGQGRVAQYVHNGEIWTLVKN